LTEARIDLTSHRCSNDFVPDVRPVWREAFRVLRPGGALPAGFTNPVAYPFDEAALGWGELRAAYAIMCCTSLVAHHPYSAK
jgi:SAM-dependent methyltransferase